MALSPQRKSVRPSGDDTWHTIAARELADTALDDAVELLQSWNLHVFRRPEPAAGTPREGNVILPSDVIFLEAPPH